MNPTLQWISVFIEGGMLLAGIKAILMLGRALEKLEGVDKRVSRLENWRDGVDVIGAHK